MRNPSTRKHTRQMPPSVKLLRKRCVTAEGEHRTDRNHVEVSLELNQSSDQPYVFLNVQNLFVRNGTGVVLHKEGCRTLARVLAFYGKMIDQMEAEKSESTEKVEKIVVQ